MQEALWHWRSQCALTEPGARLRPWRCYGGGGGDGGADVLSGGNQALRFGE